MKIGPFSAQDQVTITTLGLEFAVAVALGTTAGIWADYKLNSLPWCSLVGILAGFALGMYIVVRRAKLMEKENTLKDKK